MPVEFLGDFRRARVSKGAFGFAPAMNEAVFRGNCRLLFPSRPLARFMKVDNVAHGSLDGSL